MSASDFPLPSLAPLLDRLLAEVTDGRGFVLVKGLPVQRWSRLQVRGRLWWGLVSGPVTGLTGSRVTGLPSFTRSVGAALAGNGPGLARLHVDSTLAYPYVSYSRATSPETLARPRPIPH